MCRRNEEEVLLLQSGNCRLGVSSHFAKVTTFENIFSSKLLKQGYHMERLKLSFRKFYGRYGDLQQYEVSLSRMYNDILTLEHQFDFPIDQTFHLTSQSIRLSTNFMTLISSLTFTEL